MKCNLYLVFPIVTSVDPFEQILKDRLSSSWNCQSQMFASDIVSHFIRKGISFWLIMNCVLKLARPFDDLKMTI